MKGLLLVLLGPALLVEPVWSATSPGTTTPRPGVTKSVARKIQSCPEGEFLCTSGLGLCIQESWLCDDIADCDGGEDEVHCELGQALPDRDQYFRSTSLGPAHGCAPEEFKCNNYNASFVQCVPRGRLCDGEWDCGDTSDEGGLCGSCYHYGCSGACQDNPLTGPVCSCDEGQRLGEDGKTCGDVDECREERPCNHGCRNEEPGFRCECALGFSLADDQRRCVLDLPAENRLFVSFNHKLKTLALPRLTKDFSEPAIVVPAPNPRSATIPGLDVFNGKVFLASNPPGSKDGSINVMRLGEDGAAGKEILELVEGIPGIVNVAVDWVSGLVYYVATDSGTENHEASIGLCSLDGRFCARLNLTSPAPHRPRGLVVHPRRGFVFWSDWGRAGPRIEAAAMDGSWRDPEFVVDKLQWPNALALDLASERLYWGDAQVRLIESLDLHSLKRKNVIGDVHHPYDLAVFDNVVYWTDWAVSGVQAALLGADGSAVSHPWLLSPGHDDELHYGLALSHPALHSHQLYDPCAEANCSHLCTLAPDSQPTEPHSVPMGGVVARCLCPMGYMVDPAFPETGCVLDAEADWEAVPRLSEGEFLRRCAQGSACDNGGSCLPQWKRQSNPAVACHCPWGFSGRYCEVDEGRRWAALGQSGGRGGAGTAWVVALVVVALLLLLLGTLTAYYSRSKWVPRKMSQKGLPRIPSVSFFRSSGGASPLRSVAASASSRARAGRAHDEERQHIVRLEDGQPHLDPDRMDSFENPAYDAPAASASAPVSHATSSTDLLQSHHASVPAALFPGVLATATPHTLTRHLQHLKGPAVSADDSGFDTAMDSGEHQPL